ncbi:MAG: NADH-quinone oxidoreductase subunit C [Proteobacteria bacterium]|nr:MAG: NADH-quinone oxidoreductase subunit C [Pseudomonadota bacterium]
MSKLTVALQEQQNRVHALLVEMYPGNRIDLDRNLEPILWVPSGAELIAAVKSLQVEVGLQMDRLSDVTAYDNIDGLDGPKRFVMVYQLYSMRFHTRVRIKLAVAEGESVPTLSSFWRAANWLEREVYDMFGITFADHPDLRRILMDERFVGHPLRKEYDLKDRQPFPDSLPVRIAARTPLTTEQETK